MSITISDLFNDEKIIRKRNTLILDNSKETHGPSDTSLEIQTQDFEEAMKIRNELVPFRKNSSYKIFKNPSLEFGLI